MLDNLTRRELDSRSNAKMILRRFFLNKDGVNLKKSVSELLNGRNEDVCNLMKHFTMTSRQNAMWHLGFLEEEIPEGFKVTIGNQEMTKKDLTCCGLGSGDLLQLWLYGEHVHIDDEKKYLLGMVYRKWGENFVESFIDMYTVIVFRLFSHILLPMIDKYNNPSLNE